MRNIFLGLLFIAVAAGSVVSTSQPAEAKITLRTKSWSDMIASALWRMGGLAGGNLKVPEGPVATPATTQSFFDFGAAHNFFGEPGPHKVGIIEDLPSYDPRPRTGRGNINWAKRKGPLGVPLSHIRN